MEVGEKTAGILLSETDDVIPRQASLIERLPEEARERIKAFGRSRTYQRGETILSQGAPHDGIFLLDSGLIRSFYTAPSGREITLAYWLPGNFVGGPDIFSGGVHMWSAVAAKQSEVTHLPGAGLRELAREVPDFALAIIDALSFKARCYSSLAQMLGTRSMSQRLAHVLLHLAQTYGFDEDEKGGGTLIAAAFTHAEIASLIGATRQWVTISLNRLQDAGVLRQKRGLLVIKRPDLLSAQLAADAE
ncbi:Crp/Fnr family transcriptional regulator [Bradyrhizobium jicamae]|uniref:Crp/Fnr family transcriptional regulator n=1 Tax=Bradyrhizobium jicamae TaxID=280332 RepID=UPI001BA979BB|nr:Crp/Fnr family transcriptional regulator [Bradyrhizobium jicamae]MBR0751537.1 Crp/Fnr family transcriptional regulator [Bradyrhizobium jicamae]